MLGSIGSALRFAGRIASLPQRLTAQRQIARPAWPEWEIQDFAVHPIFHKPQHALNVQQPLCTRRAISASARLPASIPARLNVGAGDIDGCLAGRKVHAELERSVRKGRSLRGARLSAVSRQKLSFCDLKYSSASGSTSIAVPN
jgi:hypothetical protein